MLAFSIDYYGVLFRATQSVGLFCTYNLTGCNFQSHMQLAYKYPTIDFTHLFHNNFRLKQPASIYVFLP